MADLLEIIVGTYEEFLLGYKINKSDSENDKSTLSVTFSTRSHTASIRSIAIGGSYLISGSADDKIVIYDMKTRKEVNILMNHEGTINTVCFTPDNTHILSGGDDGRVVINRVGNDWKIVADWKKAHNGSAVTHISCHPTGKLALSLGSDLKLKTWNLITGSCVHTINLKKHTNLGRTADCIQWSTSGDCFLLTGLRVIEVFKIDAKNVTTIKEIQVESKPISACWLTSTEFIVGLENGKLLMSSIHQKDKEIFFDAHEKRVKAIAYLNKILVTTSSSGEIIAWNINIKKKSIKKIASTNTGCRPTCIALLDLTQFDKDYKLLQTELSETNENSTDEVEEQLKTSKKQNVGKVIVEFENDENNKKEENVQTSKLHKKRKFKSDLNLEKENSLKQKSKAEVVKSKDTEENTLENDSDNEIEPVQKKKSKKDKTKLKYVNAIKNLPNKETNTQDKLISVNKNNKEKNKKKKNGSGKLKAV